MYACYFIVCPKSLASRSVRCTYIGIAKEVDLAKRLRKHNRYIAQGGAKFTCGRLWNMVCWIDGFKDLHQVCKFEFYIHQLQKRSRFKGKKTSNDIKHGRTFQMCIMRFKVKQFIRAFRSELDSEKQKLRFHPEYSYLKTELNI
jgi:predicted GIY-YIG superfamily endonuclease